MVTRPEGGGKREDIREESGRGDVESRDGDVRSRGQNGLGRMDEEKSTSWRTVSWDTEKDIWKFWRILRPVGTDRQPHGQATCPESIAVSQLNPTPQTCMIELINLAFSVVALCLADLEPSFSGVCTHLLCGCVV